MFSQAWSLLKQDHWLLSFATWVPMLVALTLWWIFAQGTPRQLPVGVVDLSHSHSARTFMQTLQASPTLQLHRVYADATEAKTALVNGDIYAYSVIPSDFERGLLLGLPPRVSTFYNSQYILTGRLISSAVMAAQATFNAEVETLKTLMKGDQTAAGAVSLSVPIQTQVTALFNRNNNYAQFLVSAMVPALWQILMVVITIMVLSTYARQQGLQAWLKGHPVRALLSALWPFMLLFWLQGLAFLLWFYVGLGWPFHGDFTTLMVAQALTVVASTIMGVLFYFLTLDAAHSMSFAGAFTAPSFAFLGVTFPVSDMVGLAQFWRDLVPVTHYIGVQIDQANYGLSAWASLSPMWVMVGYAVPALVAFWLIKRHLKRQRQPNPTTGGEPDLSAVASPASATGVKL